MPSPLGHVLAGIAAGWLVGGTPPTPPPAARRRHRNTTGPPPASSWLGNLWRSSEWRAALLFAFLGAAPDLDLLVGRHSMESHSIGAAAVAGVIVGVLSRSERLGLSATAAWASHILLDWLGRDGSPPVGIMALWPFSREFFEAGVHLFLPIDRRWWVDHFITHNLTAVFWELVLLAPVLWLVWWGRRQRLELATGRRIAAVPRVPDRSPARSEPVD